MVLTLFAALTLARACAPGVAPETLLSVAQAESAFDPLVIGVNGPHRQVLHPTSPVAAAALAARLIAAGASVDLGVAQINSRNLPRLGLNVAEAFDPCRSLAAAARRLREGFQRAAARADDDQVALRVAFSLYNTGDPERGRRNGYVARVTRAAARIVSALRLAGASSPDWAATATRRDAAAPVGWDARARPGGLFVF